MVKTCIVTGYGINADIELSEAFRLSGSDTSRVHVNDLIENPSLLASYQILAFPGGFSFGDHLGSGKVFGNLFKRRLKNDLDEFIRAGKLVIGICNGFQVLVKMGILPNLEGNWEQDVSLIHNDSGKFEDRWVRCGFDNDSPCVWTRGIRYIDLPVRHGEGKFIIKSESITKTILDDKLGAVFYTPGTHTLHDPKPSDFLVYPDNPNGSFHNIAGICDRTGHVFGLMPHPEAFIFPEQHPLWKRQDVHGENGLAIFKNAISYFG